MSVTFQIVLFNPQIPPNTGNILRLCANTGSNLHIIKPIGFSHDAKSMRRAGLDYYSNVKMHIHENLDDFLSKNNFNDIYLITKFGKKRYDEVRYKKNDYLMFGSEINGLSEEVHKKLSKSTRIFIPMFPENRSINLANAVSICIYEAWKQINFSTL